MSCFSDLLVMVMKLKWLLRSETKMMSFELLQPAEQGMLSIGCVEEEVGKEVEDFEAVGFEAAVCNRAQVARMSIGTEIEF